MIPANVIHRVFRLSYGTSEGTAFTIDVDGREYLITAKHIVSEAAEVDTVGIFSNGEWRPLEIRVVAHAKGDVDISVLAVDRLLTPPRLPMEPSSRGLIYGQNVFFLGYPYGYIGSYTFQEDGYPLPFVKGATLSLLEKKRFLLDGHNNPGFSGGPVVYSSPNSQIFKVAAVISGFKAVEEPIYAEGKESGFTYRYNTGIVVSDEIETALELARSNPIGKRNQ